MKVLKKKFRELANKISDTLSFMEAIEFLQETQAFKVLTSLQVTGSVLPYEEYLTRLDSTSGEVYDTAHMVWIGDRTRQPDGAHVEFCRGIKNPIGIKCGHI